MTLGNEGADQIIEGIAVDNAGNTNFTSLVVSMDQTPPTVTGQPQTASVSVNGIAAAIDWNSLDEAGNVRFVTSGAVPVPGPGEYVPLIVSVSYAGSNTTYNYPAGVLGPYFITRKETRYQIYPFWGALQKFGTGCFGIHYSPSHKELYAFVLPITPSTTFSNEYRRSEGLRLVDWIPGVGRPCGSGPDDFGAILSHLEPDPYSPFNLNNA